MGKITKGQVKNSIGRSLSEIVSKSPTKNEIKEIWHFFNNKCAFCEKELLKGQGHLDHLVPFDNCGKNGKYNRVLSCPDCNSKEKRDKDWNIFLKEKCGNNKEKYKRLKSKIDEWISNDKEKVSKELLKKYLRLCDEIKTKFDSTYIDLEQFRDGISK